MKKIILLAIVLMSCESKNVIESNSDFSIAGADLKIYTIDGCEYLGFAIGGREGFMTHKGNCKNEIHKCR